MKDEIASVKIKVEICTPETCEKRKYSAYKEEFDDCTEPAEMTGEMCSDMVKALFGYQGDSTDYIQIVCAMLQFKKDYFETLEEYKMNLVTVDREYVKVEGYADKMWIYRLYSTTRREFIGLSAQKLAKFKVFRAELIMRYGFVAWLEIAAPPERCVVAVWNRVHAKKSQRKRKKLEVPLQAELDTLDSGKMPFNQQVKFFQTLLDTGKIKQVEARYVRMATALIEQGLCHLKGEEP